MGMKAPLKKNIVLSLCTVFFVTGLVCCKGMSFSNLADNKNNKLDQVADKKAAHEAVQSAADSHSFLTTDKGPL